LWTLVVVLLGVVMGLVTYYYHVTEPQDEEESQQIALLVRELIQPQLRQGTGHIELAART
jgi:hypothetical protein